MPLTNTVGFNSSKCKGRTFPDAKTLVQGLRNRNISLLGRAITCIESTNKTHQKEADHILKQCLPYANAAIRIGITGVPGVGKSTFIDALGTYLISLGKRVAVLTVDPSSTISKGSILGDKTRMPHLARNTNAFIRPSASGQALGGVAHKTRDTITLCEAAGFDVIIIETVGVGQNETAVHSMTDVFLLLKLAGAGDALQGIKRGIIEMADAIIINKADGDTLKHAHLAKIEFERALQWYPQNNYGWSPKVTLASGLEHKGIKETWQLITTYLSLTKENKHFEAKRNAQKKSAVLEAINGELRSSFFSHPEIKAALEAQLQNVEQNIISPSTAVSHLLHLYKTGFTK